MIFVSIENSTLGREVEKHLGELGVEVKFLKPGDNSYLGLYQGKVSGVVVDGYHPTLPDDAWSDMLNSLAKRIPVVVLNNTNARNDQFHVESIFKLKNPELNDIVSTLDYAGALGRMGSATTRDKVTIFDPRIPLQMLSKNKSLSVLCINAQDFQQIATDVVM